LTKIKVPGFILASRISTDHLKVRQLPVLRTGKFFYVFYHPKIVVAGGEAVKRFQGKNEKEVAPLRDSSQSGLPLAYPGNFLDFPPIPIYFVLMQMDQRIIKLPFQKPIATGGIRSVWNRPAPAELRTAVNDVEEASIPGHNLPVRTAPGTVGDRTVNRSTA
jgi:hypothetical protein